MVENTVLGIVVSMFEVVQWHFYLHVRNSAKAERVIGGIQERVGVPFDLVSCEPYWKLRDLIAVRFKWPLGVDDPGAALLETLRIATRIASPWELSGSFGEAASTGDFDVTGIASNARSCFTVPGLEWALFSISDVRLEQ